MNPFILSPAFIADGSICLGTGRLIPTAAAVVGLGSVILSGLVLARSNGGSGAHFGRLGARSAVLAGLGSLAVGGGHAAYCAGGVGTGNGLAGAFVAMGLGLIGMILGGFGVFRFPQSRRDSRPNA